MNIENVLSPLRQFGASDNKVLSFRVAEQMVRQFRFPEYHKAWAAVSWQHTSQTPVSEWLGSPEKWTADDHFIQQARVVSFVAFIDDVPVLADGHPWSLLVHQAGGYACLQPKFGGKRILLKPTIESEFLQIANYWYGKELGQGDPSLSELTEYRAQLQKIGLDCNRSSSYRHVTEAFYPIDLSQEVINHVSLDSFSLDSILGQPRHYANIEHMAVLLFIAPNSD